jgi:hypothetical protein
MNAAVTASAGVGDVHTSPLLEQPHLESLMASAGLDAVVLATAANVTYATGYFYWARAGTIVADWPD